ncbi:MAG TPA: translation initiation factor [Verrucomicrobiae bacterium]|nr:translation initiation factor [Verrucomicrobiae bacterium]
MAKEKSRLKIDTRATPAPLASPFASLDAGDIPAAAAPRHPATSAHAGPAANARLVIRKEKSGRGGKTVLVISGFPRTWTSDHIAELASRLKRSLGTGGAAHAGEIEIQGDVAVRLRTMLEREGFRVVGPG